MAKMDSAFRNCKSSEITVGSALREVALLEQSILNRAFRGELVPQDHDDEPASVLLERIRTQRAATGREEGSKYNWSL